MLRFYFFLWVILFSAELNGQPSAYEEDILKFLQINGTIRGNDLAFSRLYRQLSESHPAIPDSLQQLLHREVFEPEAQRLTLLMIPVYKKHFSHEEIRILIAFYESPAGAKFAGPNAVLANDLVPVIRDWSSQLLLKANVFIQSVQH